MRKPFIVHTGELNIQVLGTTFNVASYPDDAEIKVSLVEGSVNVYTTSDAKRIYCFPLMNRLFLIRMIRLCL